MDLDIHELGINTKNTFCVVQNETLRDHWREPEDDVVDIIEEKSRKQVFYLLIRVGWKCEFV